MVMVVVVVILSITNRSPVVTGSPCALNIDKDFFPAWSMNPSSSPATNAGPTTKATISATCTLYFELRGRADFEYA
jgi:hypothetical protein